MSRDAYRKALAAMVMGLVAWVAASLAAGRVLGPLAAYTPSAGFGLFVLALCGLLCARIAGLRTWPVWGLVVAPILLNTIGQITLMLGLAFPHFQIAFNPLSVIGQVIASVTILAFLSNHPDDKSLGDMTGAKVVALASAALLSLDAALGLQSTVIGLLVQPDQFSRYYFGGLATVLLSLTAPIWALALSLACSAVLRRYRREGPPASPSTPGEEPSLYTAAPHAPPSPNGRVTFGRRGLS